MSLRSTCRLVVFRFVLKTFSSEKQGTILGDCNTDYLINESPSRSTFVVYIANVYSELPAEPGDKFPATD